MEIDNFAADDALALTRALNYSKRKGISEFRSCKSGSCSRTSHWSVNRVYSRLR